LVDKTGTQEDKKRKPIELAILTAISFGLATLIFVYVIQRY